MHKSRKDAQKSKGCTKAGGMHKSRRDAQKPEGCTKVGGMHKSRKDAQKAEGCAKAGGMHKRRKDAQKSKGCTKGGRMRKRRRDAQSLCHKPKAPVRGYQSGAFTRTAPWARANQASALVVQRLECVACGINHLLTA
eukprot:1156237-Pelagomonas_calceolata.AAC.5